MLLRATAGLLAAALVVPVFADPPTVPVRAPVPAKAAEKADLAQQLAARVTLDKGFEGTFKEAVKMLAAAYELPLVIDTRFGDNGAALCGADDSPVKLPKLTNVRLNTVLELLAEQVRGKVLLYPDHVKLVPAAHWAYETGVLAPDHLDDPNAEALLPTDQMILAKPLTQRATVNLSFRAKPLSEALDEIADATGANVALAPAVPAAVRAAPITARFANAPVATAVRTLCELSETGAIEDGNVIIVTTRERAQARAKDDAQKRRDRQPPVPPWAQGFCGFMGLQGNLGFGGFGGGVGGNPAPGAGMGQPNDMSADVMKLKEQNERLMREIEELKKAQKK